MGDQINYRIIQHSIPEQLSQIVSGWRDAPLGGWELHGPLIISGNKSEGMTYSQAIIREPENTTPEERRKSEGIAERHKAHQEKIALSREAHLARSGIRGVCPHCGERADPEKSWQHKNDCPHAVPF